MSSSALPQSAHVSMLRELLAAEKENTRRWLRAVMARLVDPLLDTLFYRLETKLANGLERTQSGVAGHGAEEGNSSFTDQSTNVPQSFVLIPRPSPSTSFTSSLNPPLSYFNPYHANMNYSHPIPIDPRLRCHSSLANELTNGQSRPMLIKHEIEATANEPMAEGHFAQYLFGPIVNEQSNDNLANWDEEDEEECDCDECVYGIEVKEEYEEYCDGVQWIEDDHELSRPAKKPKIFPTQENNAQPEVVGQSSRQPIAQLQLEAQPNQVNKQIITVHLQCPQSNCLDTFAKNQQLNRHMLDKHFLGPHRCLVKECEQSFDSKHILSDHIKQAHQNTNQWHCSKCVKHFATYQLLFVHNYHYHHLGHFQCSFPACTFTGEYRGKMYNHYKQQHKQTLNCQHFGCNFRTSIANGLKRHERIHSGIKLYRCKWPQCHYASAQKSQTIRHIRFHFPSKPSSVSNGEQLDPKSYLEVIHELL